MWQFDYRPYIHSHYHTTGCEIHNRENMFALLTVKGSLHFTLKKIKSTWIAVAGNSTTSQPWEYCK